MPARRVIIQADSVLHGQILCPPGRLDRRDAAVGWSVPQIGPHHGKLLKSTEMHSDLLFPDPFLRICPLYVP